MLQIREVFVKPHGISRFVWLWFFIVGAAGLLEFAVAKPIAEKHRPEQWARPIELSGVPNLHQVSPVLYRSAQPTAAGFERLKTLGVKTVVNLRNYHSDEKPTAHTGLISIQIPMNAWHPTEDEAVQFLKVVTDKRHQPVLVHCQAGADRTGAMCAIYRIAVQNWSKEDALAEMTNGGYGFHGIWANLKRWITKLDPQKIKQRIS